MELGLRQLLLDDDLPPMVREALTIADRSASPELARRALARAVEALVSVVGLTLEEAAALVDVEPELDLPSLS